MRKLGPNLADSDLKNTCKITDTEPRVNKMQIETMNKKKKTRTRTC